MARGETRGQRRKRMRRERTASPPYADHSKERRSSSEQESLAVALEGRRAWVKVAWATPGRRLALSAAWIALAGWALVFALANPEEYFDSRFAAAGFVAAPALVMMFGLQFVEAVRDLASGRSSVPVFHRLGWWLDRRGLPLVIVYVVVMFVALNVVSG